MEVARLAVNGNWETVFNKEAKTKLEEVLPAFLRSCRWFGGKARRIRSVDLEEAVQIPHDSKTAHMTFVRVHYAEGAPDTYALPLAFVMGPEAERMPSESPQGVLARLTACDGEGLLVTPMRDRSFCHALLDAIGRRKSFKSDSGGEIRGVPTRAFRRLAGHDASRLEPSLLRAEQSNSSILYGDRLILKVFRRLDEGSNPDLEVGAFLTEAGFAHIPAVGGALEYRREKGEPITLGILQKFIRSEGDAWSFTLDALSLYYERVAAHAEELRPEVFPDKSFWELVDQDPHPQAQDLIGPYLEAVGLLGKRTAELHLALASDHANPAFAPEPFSPAYQRSLHQSMQNLAAQTFQLLGQRLPALPEGLQEEARRVHALEAQVLDRFRSVLDRKITAMRTRVHGDYHLGQVLYTGSDFVIIDFEGEPARPISERRIKRSPLRDVAGMLRSFHYAAYAALMDRTAAAAAAEEDFPALEAWANRWYATVSSVFLKAYLEVAAQAPFLPKGRKELVALLDVYQLEKAIYEIAYELNNRPDWLRIPLRGILGMLADPH
ncbi:MAG TPA: putative maltokinase [Terriglobia bacterium]|nr:putative maltokinase [Terriglobia bacterium]